MKTANKIFYVPVIETQQLAAIDLPGYSHMTPDGEGSYPGSGRETAARFRVYCLGVNKGDLERAVRNLPGYMQGFNVVTPYVRPVPRRLRAQGVRG